MAIANGDGCHVEGGARTGVDRVDEWSPGRPTTARRGAGPRTTTNRITGNGSWLQSGDAPMRDRPPGKMLATVPIFSVGVSDVGENLKGNFQIDDDGVVVCRKKVLNARLHMLVSASK